MSPSRRDFFKLAALTGATLASADSAAAKTLYSYVIPPDDTVPGIARWYASVCNECPARCGIRVRTREGRAVMIEGNPAHPVNQGGLCARGHAALQGLYNPDRLSQPVWRDRQGVRHPRNWDEALKAFTEGIRQTRARGQQLAFLGPALGSLGDLVDCWLAAMGGGVRGLDQLPSERTLLDGYQLTYGQDVLPRFRLDHARTILSVGADFLETWWSPVECTRGLATMRHQHPADSFFAYIGPRRSLTAANADRFVPVRPGAEQWVLLWLLQGAVAKLPADLPSPERALLEQLVSGFSPQDVTQRTGLKPTLLNSLAQRLSEHAPALVLTGGSALNGQNGAEVAMLSAVLNHTLGAMGKTVELFPAASSPLPDTGQLVTAMEKGEIGMLVIQEANPIFTTPQGLRFTQALRRVPLVVTLSSFSTETTEQAHLTLPILTPLERWDDMPIPGNGRGLAQPVMQPVLTGPRAPADILLDVWTRLQEVASAQPPAQNTTEYIRARWLERVDVTEEAEAVPVWAAALEQGGAFKPEPSLHLSLDPALTRVQPAAPAQSGKLTLVTYPSPSLYDGRGANRPWLHELPDPMTRVVWGGWVEIHPETARAAGIQHGERVRIRSSLGEITLSAILTSGHHPSTVVIPLGFGHQSFGRYANVPGANPLALIEYVRDQHTGVSGWAWTPVTLHATGQIDPPVVVVGSTDQNGRELARTVLPGESARSSSESKKLASLRTFTTPHEHPLHRWGMAVDLDRCVGCNACMTACSAENNLPVVGRTEMSRNHGMHWIRIDRYDAEHAGMRENRFLPMFCQQCDQAPCETVCPVYATYHTPQGLNAMVYNRCIGTRYCENNCPYSVRSFNWFEPDWPWPLNLQLNPDVSVRSVGVTEKCTFCVQRIRAAEEDARLAGRAVRDGEVRPACVSACPADALVFGDQKDEQSAVSQAADSERAYHVLEHLNTKPAITYLARIKRDNRRKA